MSKPTKTADELIAMAKAELKVHADFPDGIDISVIPDGDTWEFRASDDLFAVVPRGWANCCTVPVAILIW